MSHVYRYRHVVRVLVALACTLLGLAASAPAAFAVRIGANDSGQSPAPFPTGKYPTHTQTHTIVTGGMPGWQLAVIVTVATLVVAIIAVVMHRVRGAQRNGVVPAT
jgi:biopolymer transport protein ExbB/TolQ